MSVSVSELVVESSPTHSESLFVPPELPIATEGVIRELSNLFKHLGSIAGDGGSHDEC